MTNWLLSLAALLGTLVGGGDEDLECLRLGALDAVRVLALTTGEPGRLSEVYVSDDAVAADRALMADYSERGLALRGGALERLECRLIQRREDRVRLEVVDRLGPTWVMDTDGRRRELPRAAAERRVVTLVESEGRWRILSAR
ncbi:hypothetical protein [Aeromicrobium sp. CTD01-1L150]|uniref:hypothetical protein n=1 Tax=Aeromicrobium sp. CTD01-1L150 TaxID=3341830 RepID=UPI0035BED74A